MWQTDFSYFKITGWGWYYLSTILDDFSRYIVHWELCSNMKSDDVTRTLDRALEKAGLDADNRPRLLSDNGSCYISGELSRYMDEQNMEHVRGKPNHPQTQGKIERYHRSMKNVVKLENYYLPGDLTDRLKQFVSYYNDHRYHESLQNLTPADVYFGRDSDILKQRELTKIKTMRKRRKTHRTQVLKLLLKFIPVHFGLKTYIISYLITMHKYIAISFCLILTFFLSARNVQGQGEIDPSFNIGTGFNYTIYQTALQPDGKVLC